MLTSVFAKTLRDQRRALVGWAVALGGLIAFTVAFWPTYADSPELAGLTDDLPEALRAFVGQGDLGTASGFLSSQLFAFLLPLLVGIMAVGRAVGTLAGEEERGELELLATQPVSRRRIVMEKGAAVLVGAAGVIGAGFVLLVVGVRAVGMDVGIDALVGAMTGLLLFSWLLAAIALAVGAAWGRRVTALAAAAAVGLAAYLVAKFTPLVPGLDWLADLSPWTWAFGADAVAEGPSAVGAVGLVVLAGAALAVGAWRFDARDLGV